MASSIDTKPAIASPVLLGRLTAVAAAVVLWSCLVLPAAEPGAHVDIHLPNGIERSYSLTTPESEPRSYTVGIKLDAGVFEDAFLLRVAGPSATVSGMRLNQIDAQASSLVLPLARWREGGRDVAFVAHEAGAALHLPVAMRGLHDGAFAVGDLHRTALRRR